MVSTHSPTAVLVHGAFADTSTWSGVIAGLEQHGVRAIAVPNELRGGAYDGTRLAAFVRTLDGPVILVGHSYGGVVITEAAAQADNVRALVYVAAFVLEEGETPAEILHRYPETDLGKALEPVLLPGADGEQETWLRLEASSYPRLFAADVDEAQARVLAASQRPIHAAAFEEAAGPASWQRLPSRYLVATADECLHPDAQRAMAARVAERGAGAHASHAVTVSQPQAVVDLVLASIEG
ncbi:alpha/beta fold hydrolase [Streptomyces capillispiralis]|uniref:alpha/beta fold hydrolase n=1 Tax=Streptomyces capillispiralis TaxID=68182 RepID=UPI003693A67F